METPSCRRRDRRCRGVVSGQGGADDGNAQRAGVLMETRDIILGAVGFLVGYYIVKNYGHTARPV